MNSKFLVPFETAKMLKKAGYPQSGSDMYYNPNSELKTQVELIAGYKEDYPTMIKYYIAAPAYCEVLDWLVGKKICITCRPAYSYEGQYNGFQYEMQTYDEDDYPDDIYRTREEALNAGILAALEML